MAVVPNRECLKRDHLSRLPLPFLIIIKTQCAAHSVRTPYDSYHTQPVSLINGATAVIDVALAWAAFQAKRLPAYCRGSTSSSK